MAAGGSGGGCPQRQAKRTQENRNTVMPIHLCQAYHCSFWRDSGSPTMDSPSVNPPTMSAAISQCSAMAVVVYLVPALVPAVVIVRLPRSAPYNATAIVCSCTANSPCIRPVHDVRQRPVARAQSRRGLASVHADEAARDATAGADRARERPMAVRL